MSVAPRIVMHGVVRVKIVKQTTVQHAHTKNHLGGCVCLRDMTVLLCADCAQKRSTL